MNSDIPNWAERIMDTLDRIQSDVSALKTLGSLDRERLERAEADVQEIKDTLKPITEHVGAVRIVFKWVIGLGGMSSALLAVLKLTGKV